MLRLYSSILDKLSGPINEATAVILSANTWLEFQSVCALARYPLNSTARRQKHSERERTEKMFYLHTWSRNKSSCDTRNVFWNFFQKKAFDRWSWAGEKWEERKKVECEAAKKRSEESFTNLFLFPSICYIEFCLRLRLLLRNNKRRAMGILRGKINARDIVLLILFFVLFLRSEEIFQGLRSGPRIVGLGVGEENFPLDGRWRRSVKKKS